MTWFSFERREILGRSADTSVKLLTFLFINFFLNTLEEGFRGFELRINNDKQFK